MNEEEIILFRVERAEEDIKTVKSSMAEGFRNVHLHLLGWGLSLGGFLLVTYINHIAK